MGLCPNVIRSRPLALTEHGVMTQTHTSSTSEALDPKVFRSIMSAFPTGVTVVTTTSSDGTPKGFTSNAVTSVSLDPPMLLVCVALTSETLPVLRDAKRFVVNFLKEGEHEISNRFARKGSDKFEGLECLDHDGLPVLAEHSIAHAVCSTEFEVEAGDHIVLIGRVHHGDASESNAPLLYHRGKYTPWLVG
jgi:flavin reductase (DIM6/NTAB) family NADH-FMN oxidoreductase RutF